MQSGCEIPLHFFVYLPTTSTSLARLLLLDKHKLIKQINIMLNKIIRVLIIVAIIALVINIFPAVYEWCVKGIEWLIAQGKWGIIALVACVIEALLGDN